MAVSANEIKKITQQLGRPPKDVLEVSYYGSVDTPVVIKTSPILSSGTPFPTLYYLVEPLLTSAISTFEARGLMQQMNEKLAADEVLRTRYQKAHKSYLAERNAIYNLGTDFSGGGMPKRVKCLHFLVAHSLAKGPGVNPIGDEVVALLKELQYKGFQEVRKLLPDKWVPIQYEWLLD